MKLFQKLTRIDFLIFALLIAGFFASRLVNLTQIPIFTDEAIYLRWSQVGLRDSAWRFIPLTDGKPPLYHWVLMGVMASGIFADPLVQGRIVSVFAGFASLVLIWLLSQVLFENKKLSHISALFYLISPFMLVYDRLAIVDSLLTTTSIASMLFAVLLVKHRRLDTAMLFGAAVGAGMLTKASGLLFLLLSPATILVGNWHKKKRLRQILTWMGFLVLALIIAQSIYAILRLSQFYYRIGQKNHEFIIPISQFLKEPFSMTWGNAKSLFKWQIGYLSLPISTLILIALTQLKNWRQNLLLLAYVLPTFLLIASFNKIIFPRFLLFSTPFLLILASSGFIHLASKIKKPSIQIFTLLLFSLVPIKASAAWIVSPINSNIPQADKDQYFQGQPSGHGVNEIVSIIKSEAELGPVFLGTDGTFGLTPDAFFAYLLDEPNVQVEGYYPVGKIPEAVLAKSEEMPTYFVYYNVQDIPLQSNLELIGEYEKVSPSKTTYLRLYKVNPVQ